MRRRILTNALAGLGLVGGSILVASCNYVLGLNRFMDCPGDPNCPPSALCGDGLKDGDKTGVDCGGSCSPCPDGQGCKAASDCQSSVCVQGTCLATTCNDKVKDGSETDIDCGGSCQPCVDGKGCLTGSDCIDRVCKGSACQAPSCMDGVKNGDETDVDCGGSCPHCGYDKSCVNDSDCTSMKCMGGKCAATCTDKQKDGSETGVDCGGPSCPACPDGQGCGVDKDCNSGICQSMKCAAIDVWSKSFNAGANSKTSNLQVGTDGANDIFLTGTINGTVNFGFMPLNTAGNTDAVYNKWTSSGALMWADYSNTSVISAIATDSANNIYVTGAFTATTNLGSGCILNPKPSATESILLIKLDPTGTPVWCMGFGDSGDQAGTSIAVDTSGNVIVAGYIVGSATIGTTMVTGSGLRDYFVFKVDSSTNVAWAKSFPASGISSIAMDGMGNILLVGENTNPTSFGGPMLPANGMPALVGAKLDPAGNHVWSKSFADGGPNIPTVTLASIAVDGQGDVFVAGTFSTGTQPMLPGGLDFGGGVLQSVKGSTDVFLAKLDPTGAYLWSKTFGDQSVQSATALAVDAKGQPVVVGNFGGSIDFGGGPLMSAGGPNGSSIFIAKLDPSGSHLWSRGFGDAAGQYASSMALDSTGAAILTGTFNGTLDFGNNPMKNTVAGSADIFLAKLLTP